MLNAKSFLEEFKNPKGTPLKYIGFEKYLVAEKKGHWIFRFDNNYGASIIKHAGSYGYELDKFELAVLYYDENGRYYLSYSTPIADDVIGCLTNDEVIEILNKIKKLKGAKNE